ncbi:MAG: hypothetical protein PVS2B1_25900 [Candidatus Dormibacteraceae bacterium]
MDQVVGLVGTTAKPHAKPVQTRSVFFEQSADRDVGGLFHTFILERIHEWCNARNAWGLDRFLREK